MKSSSWRRWMLDTVLAAIPAGLLSVLPSTVWAFASRGRLWAVQEALLTPGALFVGRNAWVGTQIFATIVLHGGLSLFWAGVLCAFLTKRRAVLNGMGAGFSIAILDLLVVAQAFPAVQSIVFLSGPMNSFWPWLADHLVFGAVVGAVIALRRRRDTSSENSTSGNPFQTDLQGAQASKFVLSRHVVWPTFAVSLVGFVIVSAIQGGDALLGVICGVVYPPLLSLFVLALIGTVLAIRKPSRIGWLFCAHACLLAYYIMAFQFAREILRSISC